MVFQRRDRGPGACLCSSSVRLACARAPGLGKGVLAMRIALALAVAFGAVLASPVSAGNLPSDVEQHYGIPPNAENRDRGRAATEILLPIGSNSAGGLIAISTTTATEAIDRCIAITIATRTGRTACAGLLGADIRSEGCLFENHRCDVQRLARARPKRALLADGQPVRRWPISGPPPECATMVPPRSVHG